MRIVCLIENSPGAACLPYEHGLSVYIETARHRILADTGASGSAIRNAEALGVDLRQVDVLFLSHGHFDHAGGIPSFVSLNAEAGIYMQRTAGLDYYGSDPEGYRYIGIDKSILASPQLRILNGTVDLDEGITCLSGFTGRRCFSKSNRRLFRLDGGRFVPDTFDHEQALVVRENGKRLLFSGCAHNGILNILDRFRETFGRDPDLVISGFHFMKNGAYTAEELHDIEETARELAGMQTVFYTGHCTSEPAYELLKPILVDKLHKLHTGLEITI